MFEAFRSVASQIRTVDVSIGRNRRADHQHRVMCPVLAELRDGTPIAQRPHVTGRTPAIQRVATQARQQMDGSLTSCANKAVTTAVAGLLRRVLSVKKRMVLVMERARLSDLPLSSWRYESVSGPVLSTIDIARRIVGAWCQTRPRVAKVSRAWLREHEMESAKRGQT